MTDHQAEAREFSWLVCIPIVAGGGLAGYLAATIVKGTAMMTPLSILISLWIPTLGAAVWARRGHGVVETGAWVLPLAGTMLAISLSDLPALPDTILYVLVGFIGIVMTFGDSAESSWVGLLKKLPGARIRAPR